MEVKYQEQKLSDVVDFFAKSFKPKDDKEVVRHEAFIDTEKDTVVFKLYIE